MPPRECALPPTGRLERFPPPDVAPPPAFSRDECDPPLACESIERLCCAGGSSGDDLRGGLVCVVRVGGDDGELRPWHCIYEGRRGRWAKGNQNRGLVDLRVLAEREGLQARPPSTIRHARHTRNYTLLLRIIYESIHLYTVNSCKFYTSYA